MGRLEVLKNPLDIGYTQLSTRFDPEYGILWGMMNPEGVPCCNLKLLSELQQYHQSVENCGGTICMADKLHSIRYVVLASQTPGVFNLGGDLGLISRLIKNKDRQGLMHYATMSINSMMPRINHYGLPVTTIALIQGDAFGGGLEAALTSDIIIAERNSRMGFPEILFNLIPGHGAYSLVSRKIGVARAEKMILSGNLYRAEELHEFGLVDVLVGDGEGEEAVYEYVRKQTRRSNGLMALHKARQRFNPVTYQELMDITTIWVDAALQLGENDLKVINRFMRSQQKLFEKDKQIQYAIRTEHEPELAAML
jgi:DSF synthase